MENGIQNGLPTNHDRDAGGAVNGSASFVSQASSSNQPNGVPGDQPLGAATGKDMVVNGAPGEVGRASPSSRMNDLPDEIQHITTGYVPLGLLISRLAQRTHNQLQAKILELAKMQVPAPALNGNSAHSGGPPDDMTPENVAKKKTLLDFIQDMHSRWTKALVIAAWSRKASTVSKLIDLMHYFNMQRKAYADGFDYMINIKRDLAFARLPNPDLHTALQVLSTGDSSWLPDFGYIEPPPLSAEEQLKWIDELNTLLSLRLNLEDHDKIPHQFRDYTIDSGRVTFTVEGEFEVDLTIADEDFEKQFWFLDFRFSFSPAPAELTETLRMFLEVRVNEALEKEGLQGCFNFLHEFVLTHKITEYVRQAHELARAGWVDTLKIERLNRSMAIQYWTNRYPPESPKSWFLIGVHSGKKPGAVADPRSASRLMIRCFRDGKEVKYTDLAIDDATVSTETLLKQVIARHIEYMLSTIHGKLQSKGRFLRREAALSLEVSRDEPVESALKMQLGHSDYVTVRVAPTTGFFAMSPQRMPMYQLEARLNSQPKDPTEEGLTALEGVRFYHTREEINRRGRSMGWGAVPNKPPVRIEELKPVLRTKEPFQLLWFKRRGWPANWFLMVSLSLAGDTWWLIEVSKTAVASRITNHARLPLSSGTPEFTDTFFANLTIFSAAMISQVTDVKTLYQRHVKYAMTDSMNYSLPPNMRLPAVWMCLSDVLGERNPAGARKVASWTTDYVQIVFRGIAKPSRANAIARSTKDTPGTSENDTKDNRLTIIADARFKVADRSKFSLLKGNVEQDVAFNSRLGVFALRLKAELGQTMLDDLASRIQAIERLVDCVDAIRRSNTDIKCETITLAQVVFTYSDAIGRTASSTAEANIKRWKASLDLRADRIKMSLEKGNPHLRALDSFNNLLNSDLGFTKVPQYLGFTLPVLKALDHIEDSWQDLETMEQGRVEIFHGHLDWFTIRYAVPALAKGPPRRFHISVKLRDRRGTLWWHVARNEPGSNANPDDNLKAALAKVWSKEGKTWQSLGDGASCEANDNVITLLQDVDEAMRQFVLQPPSPSVSKQPPTKPLPKANQQPTSKVNNQKMMHGQANKPRQPQQDVKNLVVLDD
ncbi:hypothetical protein JX265_006357 [Neoarthrinium moseri]|uniref:Mediator of RNA polymerase II transcription subunit 14 n=1 Tax=Neoarthrinium moseri TaxID=1658444 RepID=A0A9Q0AQJ6_9PEZI|nr:hypothetical protein JX265_006357 [Neoarthrinium moseri]